jgi:hypothetical protein
MCDLAPTHWCMQVEAFLEVVTIDISTPLAVALDGGATVSPPQRWLIFSLRSVIV